MRTVYLNASYFPAVELLSAIGTAAIILYGGYQAIDGNIEIGVVVAFIGYLQLFFDPIQQISQLYTTYQQGMAALDKIFDLLDTEPDMVDSPDAIDPGGLRGEIELDDVWFSYAGGGDASADELDEQRRAGRWRAIDLHVPAGQTVALVGETGAGKSTLAKLVARFYDPQRGRRAGRRPRPARAASSGAAQPARDRARRRASCSRARSARTSPSAGPTPTRRRSAPRRGRSAPTSSSSGSRTGSTPRSASAGVAALGRPAAARRLRARAARRAADPDPRRGDLERRRAHRAGDRARARAAARRPHRDRDRPPALDDPPRRADRRPRARPDRRVRHARRADRRPAARYAELYGGWAESAAA